MSTPQLNIDLGERADEPEELWEHAELANVACGGHAGDVESMGRACELAQRHDTQLGAHPSYEDKANFGRLSLSLSARALEESIRRQCQLLVEAAHRAGARVVHVKPHGALYHDASHSRALAQAVIDGARRTIDTPTIVAPPNSQLLIAAKEAGLAVAVEGFADRGYLPDGSLVPRTQPGALLTEPIQAAEQTRRLVDSGQFQTLCVHSDTPGAVGIARAVRRAVTMKLETLGDGAWRVALPERTHRAEAFEQLRALPFVLDALVTDRHAMVRFNPEHPPADPRAIIAALSDAVEGGPGSHIIRVAYEGPDLDEVANLCGLDRYEVVERHSSAKYTVELVGFMPGFGYLGPLDEVLARVPRRLAPQPRVPALSVAIAAGRSAVYPFSSPGGWRILGTAVDFKPFDPATGASFRLGDRVRFEAI